MFAHWPTARLKALHRVAKTRCYAFFRDPRLMIALRREIEMRDRTPNGT